MYPAFRWCGLVLATGLCLCQEASTAWRQSELIEPSALDKAIRSISPPFVICVADSASYRVRHISQAIFAGPGGTPEGIGLLKTAVSVMSKDDNIVIYCGCCPLNKCPNVRPAYHALRQMGFTHVRVLDVMNMQTEWYRMGYSAEEEKKK